jgi:sucrose phosphorylase
VRNEVGLIVYADRLGGSLPALARVLAGPLAGLFGGLHLLPFFRPYDGADAGFDPVDHTEVDPRLGTWDDVRALSRTYDVLADAIVNHVSADAPQVGEGVVLTLGSVFPDGATEEDLLRIYRPRPGLPFTPVALGDRRRLVWTTFTSSQLDLDVGHPDTRRYLRDVLARLAAAGAAMVRLDAVGYAVKTPGTSCFMTPETFAFIAELSEEAHALGLEVLVEVHSHFARQVEIARDVGWVYDFALPPLVLHALFTGDGAPLRDWLAVRPPNAITVLDTHDGIGVIDVGADRSDPSLDGLLGPDQVHALVEGIHERSGETSRQATGSAAANVDLYQVNCTFYDALGRDDARYGLARALQLFTPGIPQVYYVGLLAGENDMERLAHTGVGRDVNRHAYTEAELAAALERPVVRAQMRLIRFRNAHPAFGGELTVRETPPGTLDLAWRAGEHGARLTAELASARYTIAYTDGGREHEVTDIAELPA